MRQARKEAASETGLSLETVPEEPPFTRSDLENDAYLPPTLAEAFPDAVRETDPS